MELWKRAVGLHQQVQHSHHAEMPIQNSQSHSKCTLACNKSYSTYRLQHHHDAGTRECVCNGGMVARTGNSEEARKHDRYCATVLSKN